MIVLHLAIVTEGTGGDLGDPDLSLLNLLLALFAPRLPLGVVDAEPVVRHGCGPGSGGVRRGSRGLEKTRLR